MVFRNSRVFITGINGFIGQNLALSLLKKGAKITGLLGPPFSLPQSLEKKGIILFKGDVRKRKHLREIIKEINPEFVVHLSANIDKRRKISLLPSMIETNLKGTINLFLALQDIPLKRFVYLTTCEEYGNQFPPLKENLMVDPPSPYAFSKAGASLFLRMVSKTFGFPVVILRVFTVYGPEQKNNMLIPYTIKKALKNQKIFLTEGKQKRDFVYVKDVVNAIIKCMVTRNLDNGEIFNIGYGKGFSVKEVVLKIKKITGSSSEIFFGALPYPKNEIYNIWADINKARTRLRWKPEYSLERGLKETVSWWRKNL